MTRVAFPNPLITMRSHTAVLLLAGFGLLFTGCVGSGMSTSGTYRETIGTSTRSNVQNTVPQILTSQYGYRFDRTIDRSGYMRYFTTWKQHSLFQDEREKGFTDARSRIEVTARPRDRAAGTYTVDFKVEYRVQKENTAEWVAAEIPPRRQEYIDGIYQDLADDLTSGVMSQ